MKAQEIVRVIGELIPDDGATLKQQHGSQALAAAREIEATLVPHLEGNLAYAPLWQQFRAAPQTMSPALVGVVQVLLTTDAALAQRLDALLEAYRQASAARGPGVSAMGERSVAIGGDVQGSTIITGDRVHTGGGAYIGGSVKVEGGDFVGRDQYKTTGLSAAEVARLFEQLYAAIESRPDTSPTDKADLKAEVQELQAEVAKGDEADEDFLARRLRNIQRMAPDILEVALATLANPAVGFGLAVKKVAQRMKESAESSGVKGAAHA